MRVLRLFPSPMDAKKKFYEDYDRLEKYCKVDFKKRRLSVANIEYIYYGGTGATVVKGMSIDKLIIENESGIPTEVLVAAKSRAKEIEVLK